MTIQATLPDLAILQQRGAAGSHSSGVAWGAVLAGAAAAGALSFILLILGVGLGLSAISPWSYNGAAIGASTIGWLVFMQLAASGIGGYMAGRLRVKWAGVHGDEVHFRDTAHGLLAWAVATLLTVSLLAGGVSAIVGGAIDVGAAAGAAATPALTAAAANPKNTGDSGNDYFSDMLLRGDAAAMPPADNAGQRAEVTRIVASNLASGKLAPDDRTYLAQLAAKRSGLSQADAERRVDDVYARAARAAADAKSTAKTAADTARKAAAHSALWMFVALLLGAFVASLAATWGGRQRDHARVFTAI